MLEFDNNMEEEYCSLNFDKKKGEISIKNINKNHNVFVLYKDNLEISDKDIMFKVDKILVKVKCMKKEDFDKIKNDKTQYPIQFLDKVKEDN